MIRLTGHDFLQVGTGGTDTTNWPNNPTQNPSQADQVITNSTDPGRVYYTATDELGNFYVGDQFKVDQATGNVTLDASAFNLSGLESLRLGSVGGLIGAAVGEFSTDVTLSQNSDTKVSTQKAVKTYVDTLDGITPVGGTFTLAGISTVTGTTLFTKQLNVSGVTTFHGNVNFLDGDRLRIGSSEDLQLYHDGNHSYIAENGTGDLKLQATAGSILLQKDNGEEMIKATVDGPVELYFDDGKKIETTKTGAVITGICTATSFSGDGSSLTGIDATAIKDSGGNVKIQAQASGAVYTGIHTFTALTVSGATSPVTISHTGGTALSLTRSSKVFNFNANYAAAGTHATIDVTSGMELRFAHSGSDRIKMDSSGNWVPQNDNQRNLGASNLRWANIYSADLHCSNKGSKNDVDGTWGDYTIQEGESDLFLINNRSGKKYKFNLTEVN